MAHYAKIPAVIFNSLGNILPSTLYDGREWSVIAIH
jgi:hypothetical protein